MKYLSIVAIVALLVLAGCGETQKTNNIIDPYIGGNVALNLYLQNGAPPPIVYDGGKFPFGVNIVVENNGESDIGPGTENPYVTARVEGILPENFGVTAADLQQTYNGELIAGAHKNFDGTIIGGRVANFLFPAQPQTFNYQTKLQGNQQMTLRGTICYDYSNRATTQLCFKKDILENVQDSTICTLTGEKPVANSGGPIHITKIVQNPLGENKIQLAFEVSHVGPGEFYGRSDTEDCNPSVRNTNKYNVGIDVTIDDPTAAINCYRLGNGGSGNITLYSGAPQTVTCTITSGATDRLHTSVANINTYYRYGQFIEQAIVIQSVPQ